MLIIFLKFDIILFDFEGNGDNKKEAKKFLKR